MRNWMSGALIGSCALAVASAAVADSGPTRGRSEVLTMAVYGDSPYGTSPTDTAQFDASPAFIDSINAHPDVSLVAHVGDIHSGSQYCTQAYDQAIFDLWKRFQDPLVYTPGDNEWTDCHKNKEGGGTYNATTGQVDYVRDANGKLVDYAGGDPISNLALVRSIFFRHPGLALGAFKLLFSQGFFADPAYPTDAEYVENVMWEQSRVLFVAINLPGGSNNDADVWYGAPSASGAQIQESADRTGADLRWLDAAFKRAAADRVRGVVILAQADMWDPEKGAAHQAGYEPFVASIAQHTLDLGVPVLMFNGDSHVYQSGNPLDPADPVAYIHPGYDVPNFHRIVVHGSTFPLTWLKLVVDPSANYSQSSDAFGPFSWTQVTP